MTGTWTWILSGIGVVTGACGLAVWWWRWSTALSHAAFTGDVQRVARLLRQGRSPRAGGPMFLPTHYRPSPLNCAIYGGHLEVVRLLLDAGADPNADQALHTAISQGPMQAHQNTEIIALLCERGAEVNVGDQADGAGRTPLELAVFHHHHAALEILLRHGADVQTGTILPDGRRLPPLVSAVVTKNVQAVATLLAHGAGPNYRTANGETLLSLAEASKTSYLSLEVITVSHTPSAPTAPDEIIALLQQAGAVTECTQRMAHEHDGGDNLLLADLIAQIRSAD